VVRNTTEFYHVTYAHIRVGHPVLLNEGDPAGELLFGYPGNILPVQSYAADVRAKKAREDTQKRGFTAAIWSKQPDGFTPGDLQRDVINDDFFVLPSR
jgi:hypothetical protein